MQFRQHHADSRTAAAKPGKQPAAPSATTAATISISGEIVDLAKKYAGEIKSHAEQICAADDALRREGDELDALEGLLERVDQVGAAIVFVPHNLSVFL